jgi:uncharacterized membrane protein
MKEIIIDWILENGEHIKRAALILLMINLFIVGVAGCAGEFISLFTHLPNIFFADLMVAIPLVYVVKFCKENTF